MIGLKSMEWDLILAGLNTFIETESQWLDDEREEVAQGAQKNIKRTEELYEKINVIHKTMIYFEELLVK
tara:strand:+ start:670 stop:876 length:207 start_codon:yes stop_codon:yes gene_type:complete